MAADMAAQPEVLRGLAARRHEAVAGLLGTQPAGVAVIARGSSDYAAIFGRYLLEAATGRPVALAAPSLQNLYGVTPRVEGWLAIGISQSGRTPEIVSALERYREGGARTVAVTNDPGSPLSAAADLDLALGAGEEVAVPATKTFTGQLAAMAVLAEALGPVVWDAADWERLPDAVGEVLSDPAPAERAAQALGTASELVAVGRGLLMPVALEAALKLREAAGVRAEGWSAADFRHGPVSVVRTDLPLLAVSASGPAAKDVEDLAGQLERAGTPVLRLADRADSELPYAGGLPEPLCAIPAAARAQQLALAVALSRGVDPDDPPGLSKVTPTV